MAHNWSGWPGAFCTKCGVEHAMENAIALNWVDMNPETGEEKWKSPDHQKLVNLCDSNCASDMTAEEFKKIQEECKVLGDRIKANSGGSNG